MNPSSSTHINITLYRGWLVVIASTGMGLVLGILYAWSVIKGGIPDSWGWSNADKALPFSIMTISFSIIMIPAGKLQDKFGPRPVVMLGGILAALGCIICGLGGSSIAAYIAGFGIVTGAGVGFGYSALTPAAIKWFPAERTGLVAGIVVAGFGLAPVILAPLASWFLNIFEKVSSTGIIEKGVPETMISLGIFILIVMGSLTWFISNPPAEFHLQPRGVITVKSISNEFDWKRMMFTAQFWLLFFMYFSGASAGLVFMSVASDLGKKGLGEWAFITVVILALGNTFGRIVAGIVSDKIGRQITLFFEFICQGFIIWLLYRITGNGAAGGTTLILIIVFIIGMNYGANLTLFPAACKDYFGIKNFGLNYGWLFMAFGAAGLVMPWINGLIKDIAGKPDHSYIIMISMLIVSAAIAILSRVIGPPSDR
ncbi:MAG: OFA family MFS transporter [Desulfatiglans sp.]|jgi:MFS family permease|nr:OFA family MFS transporter [Desulfatiglans sp.]